MTVRVPFHLHRRAEAAPAVALLLLSDDPAAVLPACACLHEPLLFPVRDGFVLVADSVPDVVPGTIRLRRLSENCYLAADADLVPALRSTEAVDLTAGRGLVFLPNRDPIGFDAARPLRPAAFLAVPRPQRCDWEPFPAGRPPSDRLTEIVREVTMPPDDLLTGDGSQVGTDDARPPQVGPGRRALGKLTAGLGKGLGAVGKALGSKKLGEAGARLAGLGAALAPRITEELLGRQEAALQNLLKKFRGGETDEALRRAVPVGDPGRGGGAYGSDRLPTNELGWSFGGLFGGGGRGGSVWAGGSPDTWRDLINEYRRAAQDAADRGDFRRAALIYAKLLSDYRAAAEVLSRGGLHHEAGILFRDKAHQPDRAAREFEKAGEHDEALRLYRGSFLFVDAGDLLRRLGEEEAAIAEYHKAAERAVELRQDYVEAGDLMIKKTGQADLAEAYFARGWEKRSALVATKNAGTCACRLVELHALGEQREPFWILVSEAEEWLSQPGVAPDADRFFNTLAECARLPHLVADRHEIRDRARLGLALKVRQHTTTSATPGTAVADLFGRSGNWSPAVVSDADFALRSALKHRPKGTRPAERVMSVLRLRDAEVTAAVQAPETGDLFVGFKDGAVVHFYPATGRYREQPVDMEGPILGLSTDESASVFVYLSDPKPGKPDDTIGWSLLHLFDSDSRRVLFGRARTAVSLNPAEYRGLLPLVEDEPGSKRIGIISGSFIQWYKVPELTPLAETSATSPLPPTTHLRLRVPYYGEPTPLTFQGGSVSWGGKKAFIGWMPESAPGSTLFAPPLAWLIASPVHVELAGLFDHASLYWTELQGSPDRLDSRTLSFVTPGGFRAVVVWRPGQVVGVTSQNRVLWLRAHGNRFEEWALPTDLGLPARAVASFPDRATNQVLIVLDDGTLVRLPLPG